MGAPGCAAYVFVRTNPRPGFSTWSLQAKLTNPNGGVYAGYDEFGLAVALSSDGNTALAGAKNTGCRPATPCGGAYVFVRNGGTWSLQAMLTAPDGNEPSPAVALSGDGTTALVGGNYAGCAAGPGCGAAHMFVRSGVTWSLQARLTAPDARAHDGFGDAVALSSNGTTALVRAAGSNCASGPYCGAAYVFVPMAVPAYSGLNP